MCNTVIVCAPHDRGASQATYDAKIDTMLDVILGEYPDIKTRQYAASHEFTLLDAEPIDVPALRDKLCGYSLGVASYDDISIDALSRVAAMRAFKVGRTFTSESWACKSRSSLVHARLVDHTCLPPDDLERIEREIHRKLAWALLEVLTPFREFAVLLPGMHYSSALKRVNDTFRVGNFEIGCTYNHGDGKPGDVMLDEAITDGYNRRDRAS